MTKMFRSLLLQTREWSLCLRWLMLLLLLLIVLVVDSINAAWTTAPTYGTSSDKTRLWSDRYTYNYAEWMANYDGGLNGQSNPPSPLHQPPPLDEQGIPTAVEESSSSVQSATAPSASTSSYHTMNDDASMVDSSTLPSQSPQGIYQIESEDQYHSLLKANPDKLIVMKFYATYCRACRSLEPKFVKVKQDPQLQNLPIVWAEFAANRHHKDLFQQLRVLTLPTVQFYDGSRGLLENFPCGPAKIPLLKKKLARFVNDRVDPTTRQLIIMEEPSTAHPEDTTTSSAPTTLEQPILPRRSRDVLVNNELITPEHIYYLRDGLPFFRDLTEIEFKTMLSKAKLLTFNPGDLIIRQGMPGHTFYVLKSGVAEMHVRSKFDDPISTPSNYLGVVVNELHKFDYFGERALTTGEPLKASVKALEKVRCFAFDVDDIPESSILNRKRRATQEYVDKLNQRYQLPPDYTPDYESAYDNNDHGILELLVRFRQIRQAAQCFDYMFEGGGVPTWGDTGEIARRTLLVQKLTPTQREEFQAVFDLVDGQKRGEISLVELRQFMKSARKRQLQEEEEQGQDYQSYDNDTWQATTAQAPTTNGRTTYFSPTYTTVTTTATKTTATSAVMDPIEDVAITREEFMGVMAEAECYNLLRETFQELDPHQTGYVRAGDLDDVLGGVRGLISDNPTNIVSSDDRDVLVDYEQFSKMLLGAAL